MPTLGRAPPVVGMALAACAGAALRHLGVSPVWTLPLLPLLLLPNPTSRRPEGLPPAPGAAFPTRPLLPFVLALLAGSLLTHGWYRREASDCRLFLQDGQTLVLQGRLVGEVAAGRGELHPEASGAGGCPRPLRLVFPGSVPPGLVPGAFVSLRGVWRRSGAAGRADPFQAGYLLVARGEAETRPVRPSEALLLLGGRVQVRLGELLPRQKALAWALVLARKEGLGPEVREAFARAGTAHLLAISGFHVGVVAGLLLLAGGLLGLPHSSRFLLGSLGVWAYVLAIGLPDAAVRAALILSALAAGRLRTRFVVPLGALAAAFLLFLLLDPGALLRPGFQLSFAGTLGLILWSRGISRTIEALGKGRIPRTLAGAVAAGIASTLATLPLVAWHFGRVSVVGIPATLVAAPLVTLAIPGIFGSLLLSLIHPSLGEALGRGVEVVLWLLELLVQGAARLPMASLWVSRPAIVAGVAGLALALLARHALPSGRGGMGPSRLATATLAGVLLWPLGDQILGRGVLELVALDVGQGDALLLRSPRGRWILVDAGPRSQEYDTGERVILPYLRRRGVSALDLLVLTHPDLDHIGGAAAILRDFPVRGVLDPGEVAGKEALLEALEVAQLREVPWRTAAAGDSLSLDGVAIRVLAPGVGGRGEGEEDEGANGASLVLELRYGAFAALLTGDAPASSEIRFLPRLLSPRVQLLKVGHHGSATSTTPELLARAAPETALISVGRRNHFGHPHPGVVSRLEGAGARVLRTDREGTLVVKARRDGSYQAKGGG